MYTSHEAPLIRKDIVTDSTAYEYHINLDERGEFSSDVRHPVTEISIFEIDTDKINEMVDDGFMDDGHDIDSLAEYLWGFGILDLNDSIVSPY